MDTFFQDLKHSVRMFAQSKAFTATTVAALALGIGANTAVFFLACLRTGTPPSASFQRCNGSKDSPAPLPARTATSASIANAAAARRAPQHRFDFCRDVPLLLVLGKNRDGLARSQQFIRIFGQWSSFHHFRLLLGSV